MNMLQVHFEQSMQFPGVKYIHIQRERFTFDSEFAFTSTVMFLFFICDCISPKIRSAFFVLEAVTAYMKKATEDIKIIRI